LECLRGKRNGIRSIVKIKIDQLEKRATGLRSCECGMLQTENGKIARRFHNCFVMLFTRLPVHLALLQLINCKA